MKQLVFTVLAAALVAGCGGSQQPQQSQSLAPTDQRPTRQLCIVAVVNYDRLNEIQTRTTNSAHTPGSEAYAVDRDRHVGDCLSQMSAREATCIANAERLTEAQDCAPTKTW